MSNESATTAPVPPEHNCKPLSAQRASGTISETECFKHYCRTCRAMEFIPRTDTDSHPRCCGARMAYLGIVAAVPGRDLSLKMVR